MKSKQNKMSCLLVGHLKFEMHSFSLDAVSTPTAESMAGNEITKSKQN